MNFPEYKERAEAVRRDVHAVYCENNEASIDHIAEQVSFLADVVADLCDDLSDAKPAEVGEWRRGMWLKEASRWYLLVEQDDDEIWGAVRFDSVGIASNKLHWLVPNSPDYQRCEAPDWWTA